ncbi:MAG: hypothetical protein J2P36_02920 [Ktedonobacteraceae bacterium]|nr:hypothetical protein [Ktedonobacteraceae bacterium]
MDESEHTQRTPRQNRAYDDEHDLQPEGTEPDITGRRGGLGFSALSGIAAGVLSSAISVGLTLANSSTYQQAARSPNDMSLQYAIFGFFCLNVVITLVLCFGAGFVVGRRTLQRSYGFIAGAIMGVIIFAGNFLVVYIPGYPSRIISTTPTGLQSVGMAIVADLVSLIILGMILGLVGLWGATAALRRKAVQPEEYEEVEEE